MTREQAMAAYDLIPRPIIGTVYRDSAHYITINGMECDLDDTPTTYYQGEELRANYRRALGIEGAAHDISIALDQTLAPVIRRDPPTVEEVGDLERFWVWDDISKCWMLLCGREARCMWGNHCSTDYTAWLQYSAIPEGGA